MRNEHGFTVTEVTVVLLIGSLIAGFSYSAYSYFTRSFYIWEKKSGIVCLADASAQIISGDLRKAKTVTLPSDSLVLLSQVDGKELVYHFSSKSVVRNDIHFDEDPSVGTSAMIIMDSACFQVKVGTFSKYHSREVQVNVKSLTSSASEFQASFANADSD